MSCTGLLLLLSLVSFGSCASTTFVDSMNLAEDYIFLVMMMALGATLGYLCSKHLEYISMRIEEMKEAKQIKHELAKMTEVLAEQNHSQEDEMEEAIEMEKEDQLEEANQIEEEDQMESGDTPKNGDRQLLHFVSGVDNILIAMAKFAQNWAPYINTLDNIHGTEREIEYFHNYLVKLSNRDLGYFDTILKEEDFSSADWQWSMEFNEDFNYEGLGFVDSVEKIIEYVLEYSNNWMDFVRSATDKKVVELDSMIMQFVNDGYAFLKIVKEHDEIAADFDFVPTQL